MDFPKWGEDIIGNEENKKCWHQERMETLVCTNKHFNVKINMKIISFLLSFEI